MRLVLFLLIGTAAFLARLLPVLSSGGLYAIDQYDAAVYFGAATALLHGELPYRDFLLLHPPGSTLALAPFAALTGVIGESHAWAVARVAMMVLGSLTAVLITRLLWPVSRIGSVLGGLFYAVFLPAVTIEVTTRLEPLAAVSLVGALVLLGVENPRSLPPRPILLAGALVGFATTMKIWGVVALAVLAVYLLVAAGMRRAGLYLAGAAVTITTVCLPFFVAAPAAMWRQVVRDQFGRRASNQFSLDRLSDVLGLGLVHNRIGAAALWLVVPIAVAVILAAVVAIRVVQARASVVLLVVFVVFLLATPIWFPAYAGLSAGVLAIVLGAAASVLLRRWPTPAARVLVATAGSVVLVAAGVQLSYAEFGDRFPARPAAAAVAPLPGCITADDPGVLLQMNVLRRNLQRDCMLVIDVGGYSHDFRPRVVRGRDERWQRFFLDYLGSGTATMKTRYHTGFGLSPASAREYRSWPVLTKIGTYELRRPPR